jgi:hypothetical protein
MVAISKSQAIPETTFGFLNVQRETFYLQELWDHGCQTGLIRVARKIERNALRKNSQATRPPENSLPSRGAIP